MAAGPRIGIDFGTSHTVALMAWPDGRVRPLLFDGSPLLPSAVYAQADGQLLVGRDAVHAARVDPGRFEASPKRRIDDGTVLLGDQEYPVPALIAAVLSYVAQEANRVGGGAPSALTLTHPAAWGVSRRLALIEGAKLAGLPEPLLVPEPVAAASYFTGVVDRPIAADHGVLVYDFGGGTFDASVVIRNADGGFDVRAVDGVDDLGGVDLDQLVVDYAREQVTDPDLWQRLTNPQSTEDRRHHRLLWDDARMTKEMLSRSTTAGLHLPIAARDVAVPRDAFEDKARPLLEQTVRVTSAVLRWSGLDKDHLAGVFLVGGSSRIPLVATLLERELGIKPTVIEQPEMVVAEGSLRLGQARGPVPLWPAGGPQSDPGAAPVSPSPLGGLAPVSATPISASPVSSTPISAAPVSGYPVSAVPVSGSPMSAAPAGTDASPAAGYAMSGTPVSAPPMAGQASAAAQAAQAQAAQAQAAQAQAAQAQAAQAAQARAAQAQAAQANATAPTAIRPVSPSPVNVWQAGTYGQPSGYQQPPPAYQQPTPVAYQQPTPTYQPAPPAPHPRRNVLIPVLAGLLVLALIGAGWLILAANKGKTNGNQAGSGNPTAQTSGTQDGASASAAPSTKFSRVNPPAWLPNGWTQLRKESASDSWISQKEPEGGECHTSGDALHIVTDNDVKKQLQAPQFTGCEFKSGAALDSQRFTDVGVEAGMSVLAGCGGLAVRTGQQGYLLAACIGHVQIQVLGASAADTKVLVDWPLNWSGKGTFAFTAVGQTLTGYYNGESLGSVTDGAVTRGKVNMDATSDKNVVGNATFADVRVFYLPSSTGNNQPTYTPPKSPKPSASSWPSTSPKPSFMPTSTPTT
jgi:hypothetical protein